jgi:hypothetical protein
MATKYMFTLYLGADSKTPRIDESARKEAFQIVSKRFDSFTVTNSTGCFLGDLEDVLVIHIASEYPDDIAALAFELRSTFDQQGVGIELGGRYFRATKDLSVDELRSQLRELLVKIGE